MVMVEAHIIAALILGSVIWVYVGRVLLDWLSPVDEPQTLWEVLRGHYNWLLHVLKTGKVANR